MTLNPEPHIGECEKDFRPGDLARVEDLVIDRDCALRMQDISTKSGKIVAMYYDKDGHTHGLTNITITNVVVRALAKSLGYVRA